MITIAVVDDHQMFLDGMIAVLSGQSNFEILFVENRAQAALIKMREIQPDILISDISMPEMNGVEFIKIIKATYPNVKILVLSMFESMETIADIDGYLLKETSKEELVKAIHAIVLKNEKYLKVPGNTQDAFAFKRTILSHREKEIIRLIAEEYTSEEIADKLFLSRGTIETHRKNIFFKLQVKNIAGLIKKAIYLGIVK